MVCPQATELFIDHLKAAYIDCFMEEVRKLWIPAGHEGSQGQDHNGYRALIGAMTRALDKELADQAEDEEDEEDEE